MPITKDDIESLHDKLRISKQQIKKKISFGNDFYTYLIENEPSSYSEIVSSPNTLLWKEAIKAKLDSILKN